MCVPMWLGRGHGPLNDLGEFRRARNGALRSTRPDRLGWLVVWDNPRRGQPGRMFLLWWKALSGSYLALTWASRR